MKLQARCIFSYILELFLTKLWSRPKMCDILTYLQRKLLNYNLFWNWKLAFPVLLIKVLPICFAKQTKMSKNVPSWIIKKKSYPLASIFFLKVPDSLKIFFFLHYWNYLPDIHMYHIWSNYCTYHHKHTVKHFHSLQITICVLLSILLYKGICCWY